jgi:hypothetical protein
MDRHTARPRTVELWARDENEARLTAFQQGIDVQATRVIRWV